MSTRLVALWLLLASSAFPATVWNWSYSRAGVSASGTFTTNDTPDGFGAYLISGITGTRNGVAITGLVPTGTPIPGNEPFSVDNLLFAAAPQLSVHGVGFSLANGDYVNLYFADFLASPVYYEVFSAPPFNGLDSELPITFSASLATADVPEPSALLLSLTGLLSLALRKRR